MKKPIIVFLASCFFISSLFCESLGQIPSKISDFTVLSYVESSYGTDLHCPVDGQIVSTKKSKKNTTITIACEHTYFWNGQEQTCNYELIIYNIQDYTKPQEASYGEVIGKITKDSALLGRCTTPDPYLILGSRYPAILYKGLYYFQPGWLNQTTDTLSYRQVESFEECVLDYFDRWKADVEASEIGEDKKYFNSLFNYMDVDSIRFKTKLDELPGPLESYGTLGFTSTAYFGRNIWESYTLVDSACEYTPVMCWQTSFRGYLENEYTLGSDIYIYGTFLGIDHSEKRIIFNVREFLTQPEETIYEERLEKITELKK